MLDLSDSMSETHNETLCIGSKKWACFFEAKYFVRSNSDRESYQLEIKIVVYLSLI